MHELLVPYEQLLKSKFGQTCLACMSIKDRYELEDLYIKLKSRKTLDTKDLNDIDTHTKRISNQQIFVDSCKRHFFNELFKREKIEQFIETFKIIPNNEYASQIVNILNSYSKQKCKMSKVGKFSIFGLVEQMKILRKYSSIIDNTLSIGSSKSPKISFNALEILDLDIKVIAAEQNRPGPMTDTRKNENYQLIKKILDS